MLATVVFADKGILGFWIHAENSGKVLSGVATSCFSSLVVIQGNGVLAVGTRSGETTSKVTRVGIAHCASGVHRVIIFPNKSRHVCQNH